MILPENRIPLFGIMLEADYTKGGADGKGTAFIRRGPWGYIWERHPDLPAVADWRMTTLAELPGIAAGVNRSAR